MEGGGDPGVRNGNPGLQHLLPWATSTLPVILEGAFTSRTARWQWRDWLLRGAVQPSILQLQVTKTQGLAVRDEAQGGFQGTLPSWCFLSIIHASSVLRRASKAELCSQVSSDEAGRHERVANLWPSLPWNSMQPIAILLP